MTPRSCLAAALVVLLPMTACGRGGNGAVSDENPDLGGSGGAANTGQGVADAGTGQPDAAPLPPLDIVPLALVHVGDPLVPIQDGDTLTLRFPPQGGFVLWTTAKARDITAPQAEIRTRIRSLETGLILAEEGRTPNMGPVPGEDGWFQPVPVDLRNVNHVPLCPNYDSESINGATVSLEVSVSELDNEAEPTGRKGVAKRTVKVACAEGAISCACQCSVGYVLGGCGAGSDVPDG